MGMGFDSVTIAENGAAGRTSVERRIVSYRDSQMKKVIIDKLTSIYMYMEGNARRTHRSHQQPTISTTPKSPTSLSSCRFFVVIP